MEFLFLMDTGMSLVIQGLDLSFLCLLERLARGACLLMIEETVRVKLLKISS